MNPLTRICLTFDKCTSMVRSRAPRIYKEKSCNVHTHIHIQIGIHKVSYAMWCVLLIINKLINQYRGTLSDDLQVTHVLSLAL